MSVPFVEYALRYMPIFVLVGVDVAVAESIWAELRVKLLREGGGLYDNTLLRIPLPDAMLGDAVMLEGMLLVFGVLDVSIVGVTAR